MSAELTILAPNVLVRGQVLDFRATTTREWEAAQREGSRRLVGRGGGGDGGSGVAMVECAIPLVADLLSTFTRRGQSARATALFSALRWHQHGSARSSCSKADKKKAGDAAPSAPPQAPLALLLPPPTRALHQAMLRAFCSPSHHKWPVALALLRKMQSRALPHLQLWQLEATAPTCPCYTTVIEGAVRGGDMPAALSVLRTMESHGMFPSQRCLVALVRGFAAAKYVGGALGVWRELRLLYPQAQTSRGAFEAIVSACVMDSMGVEAALSVLEDMTRSGWSLDRQYYLPLMVHCLCVCVFVFMCLYVDVYGCSIHQSVSKNPIHPNLPTHKPNPRQDGLGYDALNLEKLLEPFRLNVGYINVGEDELAALLLAYKGNGLSLPKAAAQLCAFGVGLPPMTMVYLRLDQPARPKSDERRALLAAYEMRTTVAELGWLAMDSEYGSPALEARRAADLSRRVVGHFAALKEELFRLRDPQGRRLERLGLGVLAGAAIAEGPAGEELRRIVGSSKAGRREAKGERSRRQLTKLKEQGRVGGVVTPVSKKGHGQRQGEKGAAAAAPPARVVDQRQQAWKLFGGDGGGGGSGGGGGQGKGQRAAPSSPSSSSSKPKGGNAGGGGKKGGGASKDGSSAPVQSQPPQKREKR